ncbi:peptidase S8/S53 subtilisin kexin sedolisin [Burkholderia pseudomallei]|nr:peptidase S8/S53 subtilisin kexin sedolisin [Burkholderia pseudomallei]CAK0074108.1 peptidase S8/S53 subtilisin kexin sedolisin [Burkholderia pseudomallei]
MNDNNPVKKIWNDIKILQKETLGEQSVCIAVLDGSVDIKHSCFSGSSIKQLDYDEPLSNSRKSPHGTHVASIIFGRGQVNGISPNCSGLFIKIFNDTGNEKFKLCSQSYLAHSINTAILNGANIITISGGQLSQSNTNESDPLLIKAIENCTQNNILVIAAAGNDGCPCIHTPAALPGVLVAGALSKSGLPMESSNWGSAYQQQGILAPGENIRGAAPGGGTSIKSGTSFAAPIVAGVAGLLMSIQRKHNGIIDSHALRSALLQSAQRCPSDHDTDFCRKYLMGIIDVDEARNLILKSIKKEKRMSDSGEIDQNVQLGLEPQVTPQSDSAIGNNTSASNHIPNLEEDFLASSLTTQVPTPSFIKDSMESIQPSEECKTCNGPQLVYALGELTIEFPTDSSRNSFGQALSGKSIENYLSENLHEAPSLYWVLKLDNTPIYVIKPTGPFSHVIYQKLLDFLKDKEIERISVPGYTNGRGAATLLSGETVPILVPEGRGLYSWSSKALLDLVVDSKENPDLASYIEDFLNRIYYDFRNTGILPQDRALNYAATNLFQAADVLRQATDKGRVLETITVGKSSLVRPEEELYDVKMRFFDPENVLRAKRAFRFTIDVSDAIPVGIGRVRVWNEV